MKVSASSGNRCHRMKLRQSDAHFEAPTSVPKNLRPLSWPALADAQFEQKANAPPLKAFYAFMRSIWYEYGGSLRVTFPSPITAPVPLAGATAFGFAAVLTATRLA